MSIRYRDEIDGQRHRRTRDALSSRAVRFVIVGATCALVQLGALHALVTGGLEEHVSNLLAFAISVQVNFVLSQFFTWRDRWSGSYGPAMLVKRLFLFNASATTTGIVNQGVFALANIFISYLPAAAFGIAVAALTNFTLNDRLVFRTAGVKATQPASKDQ